MNPLFEDLEGQPASLRRVLDHQKGSGRAVLERVAAEVRHARRLVFTGMGSSLFASMAAAALLNAHGRACAAIEASELLYFGTSSLGRDTLAILISRSGGTVEVLRLIPKLRERGVRIVGVTNEEGSALARQSDLALVVGSDPDHLVALRTYTGTAAALLLLASRALERRLDFERLPEAMEALVTECIQASKEWQSWLAPARAVYLLGRGPSLGSVHEGALLFHESARTPAIGMSVAHFRHGPVEVVSPDFRGIVFATQPETQKLDAQLAADLNQLGAQARVIGSGSAHALANWPSAFPTGPLASVLEIIPVQIAAARLAEWRGIPPASFQFAPMVTVEETGFANPATRR